MMIKKSNLEWVARGLAFLAVVVVFDVQQLVACLEEKGRF
jgi:hypothetical protein